MEESPELPSSASPPAMSLGARLANIFVAPGEVFENLQRCPPAWPNWTMPLVLLALLGIVYALVVFSQPAVLQTIQDAQDKAGNIIRQQVAAGKMPQAQADRTVSALALFTGPSMLKAIGILRALFGSALQLVVCALVVWLVGRFALRAEFGFHRAVEITGLTMMIAALGVLVATLLAVIYGNVTANASPTLLLSHFDPKSPAHQALAGLNFFALWRLAVVSLGLARLTGTKVAGAAGWIFGI
jgi:hypothetical protein